MFRIIKVAVPIAAVGAIGFAGMHLMPRAAAAPSNDHTAHAAAPALTASQHIAHLAAAGDIHANHAMDEIRWAAFARQAAPASASLPADDMGAVERLKTSPRKGEFVTINVGGTPMRTWVVHPQGAARAPVVVVIQEIFGLSDWIRAVADQLAAEGFIAVAPDLLAGRGPNGGDSTSIAGNETMKVTLSLSEADLMARVKAARDYGLKLPQANGKSASVGFCFGGAASFTLAANEPNLNAAVVYYGQAPTSEEALARIKAPVLGLYGGLKEDARIGATIAPTEASMKKLGKAYEPHIFEGAAHGFLRAQTGANGANMKASQQAWPLTVAWIKKYAS
jgi:carboxymethylenebutenolidase